MNIIFLDHNSTTPVLPEAVSAMLPYFNTLFYNPGCVQYVCDELKTKIIEAKNIITKNLNRNTGKLIFTSSASESNNLAIKGFQFNHFITSPIEHPSVCKLVKSSDKFVKIDSSGIVDLEDLKKLLCKRKNNIKTLVSVQHANQVLHTIQPINEIAKLCREYDAFFHVDATQTYGKEQFDFSPTIIDLITVSSHKCYGPKGIGALWINDNILSSGFKGMIIGGEQEYGLRAGTLNVPGIIGFATAINVLHDNILENKNKIVKLTNYFLEKFLRNTPNVKLNGAISNRLAGGLHFSIRGVDVRSLLMATPEIILSTGMACSMADVDPIFAALDRLSESRYSLRMQIGFENTFDEITFAADLLSKKIEEARSNWGYI